MWADQLEEGTQRERGRAFHTDPDRDPSLDAGQAITGGVAVAGAARTACWRGHAWSGERFT